MATIKAVLKRTARKTDSTHLVMLRITRHRQAVYLGLSIYVPKAHWNPKAKLEKADWVLKKNDLHREFNQSIKEEWLKLDKLQLEHPHLSAAQLKQRHLQEDKQDLMAYFRQTLAEAKRGVSLSTRASYDTSFKQLEAFTGGTLPALTVEFVRRYEAHLLEKLSRNSVSLYLAHLRRLTRRAVAAGVLTPDQNPFHAITLKKGKVAKDTLTLPEIDQLLDLRCAGKVELARRVFLVQFFLQGMRVSDVLLMRWEQVRSYTVTYEEEGQVKTRIEHRLEYRSQKTGAPLSVKIPPPALELLGARGDGYIFPYLSEGMELPLQHRALARAKSELNRGLKMIATDLQLHKNLSTHVARHSFASLAWEMTGNLKGVQSALGHTKLAMTEVYLREMTHAEQDAVADAVFSRFGAKV